MRNLAKDVSLSFLATLAVLGAGCARASFDPVADAAGAPRDAAAVGDDSPALETSLTCPAPSVASCVGGAADPCDPVCQTGACAWCAQKCSYSYAPGAVGTQPACASKGARTLAESCTVVSSGSPEQADDCAPGSICLAPTIGDSFAYCFSLCRSDVDCPYGVACGQRKLSAAGGLIFVCDPAYDQCGTDGKCCDPLADSGCDANRYCLLVSADLGSGHSRTVCEYSYGNGLNGAPCSSARDCLTRNTCVNNTCMPVCNPVKPCPAPATCHPLGAEYGYCS
jgi:hypothetical protein